MSSIAQPVARSVSRSVLAGQRMNLGYLIRSMFSNSEQGFAYDINDLSTLFQDAAGTIPVTGAGQPVGLVKDKSGRNNHAYQTTSASRPLLQRNATTGAYYLAFDGTDDFLVTNPIDFTATDKVSLFSGLVMNTPSDAIFLELSSNISSYTGSFYIAVPETSQLFGGVPRILSISHGSNIALLTQAAYTSQVAPQSRHVLSAKHDISASMSTIRDNGAAGVSGVGDKGAGNFGNYPLYIGRRGGSELPFTGHIYSLIGVGRLSTDAETTSLEKAIAKNVGVTL